MHYLKIEIVGLLMAVTTYTVFMIWFLMNILKHFRKKELFHEEQLQLIKLKSEKELYKAQLEIQEQTFVQVSREIHDNVGQSLSLAKLGLTTLDLNNREDADSGISEISDIIEKSISDLRDISRAMNTDLVKKIGLKNAIESQIGFLQRSGKFHVHFSSEGNCLNNDSQREVIFYRILQESINNIIRHSKASEIRILLSGIKNQLKLHIQDNGSGFDVESTLAGVGQPGGIYNMRGRAELINADFNIQSKMGQGTVITVTTKTFNS